MSFLNVNFTKDEKNLTPKIFGNADWWDDLSFGKASAFAQSWSWKTLMKSKYCFDENDLLRGEIRLYPELGSYPYEYSQGWTSPLKKGDFARKWTGSCKTGKKLSFHISILNCSQVDSRNFYFRNLFFDRIGVLVYQ